MFYLPNMSTVTVELPDALAAELDAAVEAGWFPNQAEAVRAAVLEFLRGEKLAVLEQQQLSDIEWATKIAASSK